MLSPFDESENVSLVEFIQRYPDAQSAIEFLEKERWPDGAICPHCESPRTTHLPKYNRHQCNDCRKQFTVRTGTIFQNSRVPLNKWLYAMFLIHISRKGISSCQLAREIGVSQKSAWFMLQRIRESMDPGLQLLSGEVEIDETYVGGLESNKHANRKLHGRWREGRQTVLGMRERDGPILLRPIPNSFKSTIANDILLAIARGSTVYSDESSSYTYVKLWYAHRTVNHQKGEYVRGRVTTNSIESVWAVLKRAHKGIYHQWSHKHGHRYYNEIAYRLTEGSSDIPIMCRMRKLARRSFEVQLTHKELVGTPSSNVNPTVEV